MRVGFVYPRCKLCDRCLFTVWLRVTHGVVGHGLDSGEVFF